MVIAIDTVGHRLGAGRHVSDRFLREARLKQEEGSWIPERLVSPRLPHAEAGERRARPGRSILRCKAAALTRVYVGVLDRLLEEERIEIEGISATSAGAMNGTVLAHGYAVGGRAGARSALAAFWRRVSRAAMNSALQPF